MIILCYRTVLVKTKNPCWNFTALTVTCIIYTCLSFPKTQSQVCSFFSGMLNHVQNTRKTVTAGCVPTTKLDVTTACWSIWPAPHVTSPPRDKNVTNTWSNFKAHDQNTSCSFNLLHLLSFRLWKWCGYMYFPSSSDQKQSGIFLRIPRDKTKPTCNITPTCTITWQKHIHLPTCTLVRKNRALNLHIVYVFHVT